MFFGFYCNFYFWAQMHVEPWKTYLIVFLLILTVDRSIAIWSRGRRGPLRSWQVYRANYVRVMIHYAIVLKPKNDEFIRSLFELHFILHVIQETMKRFKNFFKSLKNYEFDTALPHLVTFSRWYENYFMYNPFPYNYF